MKIQLRALDMSKSKEHTHPDLNGRSQYLCLIGTQFFAGTFTKVWFGWSFNGWTPNPVGLQFDAPGTNASEWKQIWEIRKRKR